MAAHNDQVANIPRILTRVRHMADTYEYDVALSFAGEDRDYVAEIAEALDARGVRVFYDDYEKVVLWGKDLYTHLDGVYRIASRYAILFVSESYASKVWTNHERESAQARALEENSEYVLPIRLDDTEIPGLRPTIGYLRADEHSPDEIAEMVREKLGPRRAKPYFPSSPDRLWDQREIDDSDHDERSRVAGVAAGFHAKLRRMTRAERIAVCGVLAFGCEGELPELVHVSLDRLERFTGLAGVELMELLGAVRSLGVIARTREHTHYDEDDLVPEDDVDITLEIIGLPGDRGDGTAIAHDAVMLSADHFCADHGLEMVSVPDFSRLDSDAKGPVITGVDETT